MELAGEGALMALLDKRRRALAAEGLFDAARKRPLPFLPRVIGVVTSPTGAVIRDILHRLEDRCPTHVIVWPVPVQGEGAAAKVAAAIRGFAVGSTPRPDLLIVARGGGSIEDLWAFNEEEVVRAAAESPIPLISAVGHETDTTLIDFAADLRAPTPTAAAEMAVPVRAELLAMLAELGQRRRRCLARRPRRAGERLELVARRWPDAASLVRAAGQRVDELGERLPRALAARAGARARRLATRSRRGCGAELCRTASRARGERLARCGGWPSWPIPSGRLQRGFVRVTDRAGKTLIHAADAPGRARCRPPLRRRAGGGPGRRRHGAARPSAGQRVERKRPRAYLPPQPGLFDDRGVRRC